MWPGLLSLHLQLLHKIKAKPASSLPFPAPHCVPLRGCHQHLSFPTLTPSLLSREEKPDPAGSSPLGPGWGSVDLDTENPPPFCTMVRTKGKIYPQRKLLPSLVGWEQAFPEHMWKTLQESEGQAVILRGSLVLPRDCVDLFPLSLHLLAAC